MNMHHFESIYDKYFKHRNISATDYLSNNILPVYFKKALPVSKNSKILDIGCGLGQMLISLRKEGYTDISGIDISPEAIEYCSANSLNVELISDLSSYVANGKSEYDFIIMSHVVEHLEKNHIINILSLIRQKMLKPGGELVVMVPNAQSNTGCYWAYEDFTHHTLFTAGSLYFVLKSAGFESVEFLDPDGLEGSILVIKLLKKFLLFLYKANIHFWNRVTNSSFHRPSPKIFTYELKAIAK